MSQQLRYDFETTEDTTLEGQGMATRHIMRPHIIWGMFFFLTSVVLICAGGGVVAFVIGAQATGGFTGLPILVGFGALVGALFHVYASRWSPTTLARHAVECARGKAPQWASFDEKGMIFGNDLSQWSTSWAAVDHIQLGKSAIAFVVGTTVFTLPVAAVAEPDTLITRTTAWKDAA